MKTIDNVLSILFIIGVILVMFILLPIALYYNIENKVAETKLMEVTTAQIVEQNKQLGISK